MWVFILASSIHFFGVIFYAIFASGEKQHWAEAAEDAQMKEWVPPEEVPQNIVHSGYGYGNDEGGNLEASVRQPLNENTERMIGGQQQQRPYMTQTYRSSNNRSIAEDDAYHQAY